MNKNVLEGGWFQIVLEGKETKVELTELGRREIKQYLKVNLFLEQIEIGDITSAEIEQIRGLGGYMYDSPRNQRSLIVKANTTTGLLLNIRYDYLLCLDGRTRGNYLIDIDTFHYKYEEKDENSYEWLSYFPLFFKALNPHKELSYESV